MNATSAAQAHHRAEPIYGLDIIRFIAALAVLAYHLGFKAWSVPNYAIGELMEVQPALQPWWSLSWFGWVGVQVFFVLSGFVIAFSSEGAAVTKFAKSRFLRLAPALWISIPVCAITLLLWGMSPEKVAFLSVKTAVLAPQGPWIAGQIWTLAIEVMFYGAIGMLLVANSFRRIEALAYILTAASSAYWLALETGLVADTAGRITQLLLLQHGCYFALGLTIWLISRLGLTIGRVAICAVCIVVAWFQIDATLLAEHPGYGLHDEVIVPFAWWLFMVALMAASVRYNAEIVRLLPRSGPAIRTLGIMTYPLYLLHYHVGGAAMIAADDLGASPSVGFAAAIISSIAAAYVSAQFVEPYVTSRLKSGIASAGKWTKHLPSFMRRPTGGLNA